MISGQAQIHPTAVIEDGARIGEGVVIGPYCIVGAQVSLAENVRLESHVALAGNTSIGARTHIYPFASIGHAPQDLKYAGEDTRLEIGADNRIREHVTMNPGTVQDRGLTRVGDGGLFMMGAHVAHDCVIGDHVIMANNATCAGHVRIGDGAIMGGLSAAHQFVRIGAGAMVGGMSGVEKDVIPYSSAIGGRADLGGLNIIGLKRRGFDRDTIHAMRAAYRRLFGEDNGEARGELRVRAEALLEDFADIPPIVEIARFVLADSSRRFCTPRP